MIQPDEDGHLAQDERPAPAMTEQETVERCAAIFRRAAFDRMMSDDGCPEGEQIKAGISAVFSALRPGDALPGGMAVCAPLRALEWFETFRDRGDGYSELSGYEAQSFGDFWYSIRQHYGTDSCGWSVHFDCETIADHDDPDKAKTAAQADFEARVLGCFALPAVPAKKGGA